MKKILLCSAVAGLTLGLSACSTLVDVPFKGSVDDEVGRLPMVGLSAPVTIRRDEYGVPLIEASTDDDLAFATGYAMASDRLAQMVGFTMSAQGRLSEMAGPVTRDIDIYMRTLGLRQISERQLAQASPRMRRLLEKFSAGVNSYLFTHKDKLPPDFKLSGFKPEPWSPINSMDVFTLLNLGLSLNVQEEVGFLNLAAKVGPEKAAWLLPTYPDEPLPFDEAKKLDGIPLEQLKAQAGQQTETQQKLAQLFLPLRQAASNNWALAPARTAKGASILANDTHLMLQHPPVWMLIQQKTPNYHAAGIAVAGIPGVVAGYNGNVAWGMTMVMADTQDLFVEKLKTENGKTFALFQGKWEPVRERPETLRIKGLPEENLTVLETRHGPLLDSSLAGRRISPIQPPSAKLPAGAESYGLALQTTATFADRSMERFLMLGQARAFSEAQQALKGIGFINLNMVLADKYNIGWQVTGNYPERRKGHGYLPSPGWTGEYEWIGYAPFESLPHSLNPASGFVATANNRTVAPGTPGQPYITGSWYAPERIERIQGRLTELKQHTLATAVDLQNDVHDLSAVKLRELLLARNAELQKAIAVLPKEQQSNAAAALKLLQRFDGDMEKESSGAALYGVFLDSFTRETFLDELGPESGVAWQSFLAANAVSYSAQQDHLLGRDDSPFWDDVRTPAKEDKNSILARSLARAWADAGQALGGSPEGWQWGKLHTYAWEAPGTHIKPYLSFTERQAVTALARYTDRGPYPAPGSNNTVNVAGYTVGQDYKVWNIPAMRLVVDFGLIEPLHIINSGGQSGNPASSHYDDGIPLYLSGRNRRMAFHNAELVNQQFNKVLELVPSSTAVAK